MGETDAKVQPVETVRTIELDGIQDAILTECRQYLDGPGGSMLLLALPAGSGKTTAMVRLAELHAAGGRRVMYSGPRHDLFIDLMAMAEYPDMWYHWQPRRQGQDNLDTTCRWAPQMERWLARGYEAMKFCHNPRICGFDYANKDCPYHAQRQTQKNIIYAMHQHVAVGHPLMKDMSLVIGDELPLGAMLRPWLIPAASITTADPDPELERVLWTLRALCNRAAPEGGWSGPALLDELGGAEHVKEMLDKYKGFQVDADMLTPKLGSADEVDSTDYLFLPALVELLKWESKAALNGAADWVRRIHCTVDGLKLLLRRMPGRLPPHVIWCDATGSHDIYNRLFGVPVIPVRFNVKMTGRIFQVHDTLNNSTSLRESAGKVDRLKQQIARIKTTSQYDTVRLLSYRLFRDTFEADGHFGAERGTNRLADSDALIVIGTPQPPQPQIVEIAAMLYSGDGIDQLPRMNAFNTTWSSEDIEVPQKNGRVQVLKRNGFISDTQLQTVLQQLREAELIQALHRARPLRRQVDVWLLSNLPLEGVPMDELYDIRELFGVPDRNNPVPNDVDPYRWPDFIRWANETLDSGARIYVTTVEEYLGMTNRAARIYWKHLEFALGYRLLPVKDEEREGRGPKPLYYQQIKS